MSANDDLERRVADFYATEDPGRAPDWLLESALGTIDNTHQRRVLIRVPWRISPMNIYAKLVVAAVVVIAVGAIGLAVLRPAQTPGVGGPGPSPSRSASPAASTSSSPPPSPSPSPSPLPALTETYTSALHGISVSYPAGWKLRPATEAWQQGDIVQGDVPYADIIYEKESDSPFLAVASQPLNGKTLDAWATDYLALLACQATTEPVTVDGATGVFVECEDGPYALVSAGGRGYLIWLYRIDDPSWFPGILATVQLHPEDAVDTTPSPSPS